MSRRRRPYERPARNVAVTPRRPSVPVDVVLEPCDRPHAPGMTGHLR